MLLATLLFLASAQPARPFAEEKLLVERRLEALRRVLPDGPTPAADASLVRELATSAQLTQLEAAARPAVEVGTRGEVVLDVSGLGSFEEVARFFGGVELSHRLIDVETLTLTATTQGVLQLATVLRLPYWPTAAPLPPAPEAPVPRGASRSMLQTLQRQKALVFAKSDVVASRRRTRRTPRLFLSELAAVTRDRPVTLSYSSFSEVDGFVIRGLALGEGPLGEFSTRLERGFFRLSDFVIVKQAACHRFEARGRCPVAGPDAELPVPVGDPFDQDASSCRVDRDPTKGATIRSRGPTRKNGRDPLTLRMRDVDLADAFQALSLLGFGSYVVDETVMGRVHLEFTRTTLDRALTAIRRSAGIALHDFGPLRRVSPTRTSQQPAELENDGPLASFALKRVEVRDLLATMAEVDPGLASLGPPGFLGRISVWTRETPVAALRAVVLEAAGLTERIDEGRRVLERRTGSGDAAAPVARAGPEPRLVLRRDELTVREFQLAGVGFSGEARVAFAYSPSGELYAYRPGDRLLDAVVKAIDPAAVVLDTEEGLLRTALPPLPR